MVHKAIPDTPYFFKNTDRVKKAQGLGAGQYIGKPLILIEKPFTLKKKKL